MPFKANADRRHHVPKQKRKVTNWATYDASLHRRGSLTVWFTEEAIAAWRAEPRMTRGGQPWYSPLAILTALTLRAVYRLALRRTEGLIGSIINLLGLTLAVPDHSTLSRRSRRCACLEPHAGVRTPDLRPDQMTSDTAAFAAIFSSIHATARPQALLHGLISRSLRSFVSRCAVPRSCAPEP
jgi:hypothetical protein